VEFCRNCLYPDTKPSLELDNEGICAACKFSDEKDTTDWESRKKDLGKILDECRSKDGSRYDCLIPVSGGKDSHYQVHVIKNIFGLNPLLVSFHPRDLVPLGRKNIENLKNIGVDYIEFTPNPIIYKKLQKIGLVELGDVTWPEHHGIFAYTAQVAVAYNIPLMIWGENTVAEYVGTAKGPILDRKYLEEYGGYFLDKMKIEEVTKFGIDKKDLKPYIYPTDEEINTLGLRGIFLGHYFKWDIMKQLEIVKELGFSVADVPKEGTYQNWENLDTKYTAMHDYFKWIKYGFGRATDHASMDIRARRITREKGLELVKEFEGKIPTRYFDDFLKDFELTRNEFYKIVDKFTNKDMFERDEEGNFIRDDEGNLKKVVFDNPN
jgi:N-acetyl sugar amidotransferase